MDLDAKVAQLTNTTSHAEAAKLSGIEQDLDLTDSEFQLCVSILFVGYILMQVPSNLFLNKIGRPAIYLPGAMTVTIALLVMFILPDFPANTRWISDQERELATWRLTEDIEGEDWTSAAEETLFTGLKQCVRDYKTWFLVVLVFGAVSSGTINSYFPTVVQTLGYGRTETLLLTAPPYLLSCIVALCVSLNADRTGERYFNFSLTLWISVAVFIISASTTSLAARYFAMMIMLPGVYTAFTIGLTWTANTLPRPPAKRAAALALCNAVGNCSSIYGSFLYPSSTAPRYGLAMGVNAGTAFLSIVTATIFRFVLIRLNGKLDDEEGTRAAAVVEERSENADMVGLAEASNFRFLY
ncbi:hypothetical protein PRZ48_014260 [Zasmidium cellare]|uniref:Uncharacterized protein n=1 Tax=Zasmidium cellare TaxID=395010 RepID=A0ABR0E0G3_ZASCE|nr:hypothetical protein PRZ48_014260 [Zasmidium cellare]